MTCTGSGRMPPGGSGVAAGWIDYMELINERDGGINGVKLTWEKCRPSTTTPAASSATSGSKNKGADRRVR